MRAFEFEKFSDKRFQTVQIKKKLWNFNVVQKILKVKRTRKYQCLGPQFIDTRDQNHTGKTKISIIKNGSNPHQLEEQN